MNKGNKHVKAIAVLLTATLLVGGGITHCYADVGDNVRDAAIGYYDDTDQTKSLFGLIRLLIKDLFSIEERLSDKIDKSAASLEASMATMSKNVQAGQNLYVYLPLTDALMDYEGQEITLFSPSCNQQASAKLKKEGQNYCCNINYNFSGECIG